MKNPLTDPSQSDPIPENPGQHTGAGSGRQLTIIATVVIVLVGLIYTLITIGSPDPTIAEPAVSWPN